MRKSPGGYTIIEVMLVLAISSVMFVGVLGIFGSRRQGVEFSQAIYDLQSKIRQFSTQISAGNFLETSSYTCTQNPTTQRPALSPGTGGTNTNQDCIYLGKVLLPVPSSSDIYVYDILGLRNIHSGLTDTGVSVQTLSDARPEPAGSLSAGGTFTYLFSDKYTLPNGVKILSAKTNGASGGILKIYSTLQNNNTSSRGLSAYSSNYTYSSGDEQTGAETSATLRNCIEETSACTTTYNLENTGWDLCVQGTDSSRKAILTIKPSATGLVTKLSITSCS